MKKIILYLIMATSILGAQLVDGEYSVQQEGYPRGWASTARIRIEDGKIVEITTNKMDIDGELVSEDVEYNEKMLAKKGTNPKEYSVVLPQNLMESLKRSHVMTGESVKKDDFHLPEIDIIAGATSSSKKFKKMMEFLVEKAESGETGNHRMKL